MFSVLKAAFAQPLFDMSKASMLSSALLLLTIPIYLLQSTGWKVPYGRFQNYKGSLCVPARLGLFLANVIPVILGIYFIFKGDLVAPLVRARTIARIPFIPSFVRNYMFNDNELNKWMFYHVHTPLGIREYVEPYAWLNFLAIGMLISHYAYWGFVYPLQIVSPSPMPIWTLLGALAVNVANVISNCSALAYLSSREFVRIHENLSYAGRPFSSPEFAIATLGFVLFFTGFSLTAVANHQLAQLRRRALRAELITEHDDTKGHELTKGRGAIDSAAASTVASAASTPRGKRTMSISEETPPRRILHATRDRRYVLPQGGLFEALDVSCPNYTSAIIEWVGFAMFTRTYPAVAYAVFMWMYLIPRAQQVKKWYISKFGELYESMGMNPMLPSFMSKVIPQQITDFISKLPWFTGFSPEQSNWRLSDYLLPFASTWEHRSKNLMAKLPLISQLFRHSHNIPSYGSPEEPSEEEEEEEAEPLERRRRAPKSKQQGLTHRQRVNATQFPRTASPSPRRTPAHKRAAERTSDFTGRRTAVPEEEEESEYSSPVPSRPHRAMDLDILAEVH